MLRVAIQVKELISSNVTSVIESASDPVKMLMNLQREIEEAIISLQREHTLTTQNTARLEVQLTQTELSEADWGEATWWEPMAQGESLMSGTPRQMLTA